MLTYTTTPRGPGVTSRYVTQPHTDTLATLAAFKPPRKARPRAERRAYPSGKRTWCTADYVREYFRLNSERGTIRHAGAGIHAYADHLDHLEGFQPLSRALQPVSFEPDGVALPDDGVEDPTL